MARSVTCGTPPHKDDDPEGGRTVPIPVPDTRSTSSRSFPLLSYFRRCRIPRHTAVSVCRTASPSLCIHARSVRMIHQTRINHWKRVFSLRVCPSIWFRADTLVRPYNVVGMSWNLRRNNINVGADFHIMFVLFLLEKSGTFPIFFQ